MTTYDFSKARADAAEAGLFWSDEIAEQVDREFAAMDPPLTQKQVDRLMVLYLHYIKHFIAGLPNWVKLLGGV